jgi:hypothetical protein
MAQRIMSVRGPNYPTLEELIFAIYSTGSTNIGELYNLASGTVSTVLLKIQSDCPEQTGNLTTWLSNGATASVDALCRFVGDGSQLTGVGGPTSALLSITHTDTTPHAVVRGDIIAGIGASPKWQAIVKGAATHILTMGADEPGWAAPVIQTNALLNSTVHTDTTTTGVTRGALIIGHGSTPTWAALGAGDTHDVLTMDETTQEPVWGTIPTQVSNLLSSIHTDTIAASVQRGDLITGQLDGTDQRWRRFAKGDLGTILIMGADEPAWSLIPETSIIDGALLARVGSDELITGTWKFSGPGIAGVAPVEIVGKDIDSTDGTLALRPYAAGTRTSIQFNRTNNTDGTGYASIAAHGPYEIVPAAHLSFYTSDGVGGGFQKRLDIQADVALANVNWVNIATMHIDATSFELTCPGIQLTLPSDGAISFRPFAGGALLHLLSKDTSDNIWIGGVGMGDLFLSDNAGAAQLRCGTFGTRIYNELRTYGGLRQFGVTSGSLILQVPAAITSHTLIFPAAQGAASTFIKNDGSGNLSWAALGTMSLQNAGTVAITGGTITGIPQCWDFSILNPNGAYTVDPHIFIAVVRAALTVTKLQVSCDATTNQIAGDLMYADDFIGFANPVVIETFDTTSGVRVDTAIAIGAVPVGKVVYLSFDSSPASAITQVHFHIEWNYD